MLKVLTNAQVHDTSLLPLSTWALCMLGVGAAHSGSLAVRQDSELFMCYSILGVGSGHLGPSGSWNGRGWTRQSDTQENTYQGSLSE